MTAQPPNQPKKTKTTVAVLPEPGAVKQFFRELRIALYLLGDRKVPFLLKLLPVAAIAYVIWPFDPIPILGMTPIDDAVAVWAGIHYLVELSPPHVVQHYRDLLEGKVTRVKGKTVVSDVDPEDVIDGEFRPVEDGDTEKGTDQGDEGQEYDWSKFA